MKTKTYAEICVRQGQLPEAIEIYRALIAKAPTAPLRARLLQLEQALAAGAESAPAESSASSPSSPELASAPTPAPAPTSQRRLERLEKLLYRVQARRRRGTA